jgi:hypothetical protein
MEDEYGRAANWNGWYTACMTLEIPSGEESPAKGVFRG